MLNDAGDRERERRDADTLAEAGDRDEAPLRCIDDAGEREWRRCISGGGDRDERRRDSDLGDRVRLRVGDDRRGGVRERDREYDMDRL